MSDTQNTFKIGDIVVPVQDSCYGVTNRRNGFVGLIKDLEYSRINLFCIFATNNIADCLSTFDVNGNHFKVIHPDEEEWNKYFEFLSRYTTMICRHAKEMLIKWKPKSFQYNLDETSDGKTLSTFNTSISKRVKKQDIIDKMISMVDKTKILKLMSVLACPQKEVISKDVLEFYLKKWAESKYEYFLLFNEQLTIDKDFETEMDYTELQSYINDLCSNYPQYGLLLEKFDLEEIVNNKIMGIDNYERFLKPHVKSGMKVSKFLSKLFNNEDFDKDMSLVLQNRKFKGKLKVSIDPYDYLTMSDNNHSWTSCHSISDGCHRWGCLAYMIDDATLIAFRDNGNIYDIPFDNYKIKGNSKSWRQCIHFDKKSSSMYFSKHYPNNIKQHEVDLRKLMEELVSNYLKVDNLWVLTKGDYEGEYTDLINFHYSDVSNTPNFNFVTLKHSNKRSKQHIEVGSPLYCMKCFSEVESTSHIYDCGCGKKKIEKSKIFSASPYENMSASFGYVSAGTPAFPVFVDEQPYENITISYLDNTGSITRDRHDDFSQFRPVYTGSTNT